jgi:hypothetical protein
MNDEPLVIVIMPPLVTILQHQERAKGSPLTQDEVLALRDSAPAIALPAREARALVEGRGFEDISFDNAWSDWQAFRVGSNSSPRF